MKISYMNLFTQALQYTWKNKSLWIFGILAALFNTIYFVSFIDQQATLGKLQKIWLFFSSDLPAYFSLVVSLGPLAVTLTIILILALISITLAFLWLNLISQASIISTVSYLENNKKLPSFKEYFNVDRKILYRIFGLILGTQLLVLILSVAMSLPKFAAATFSISGSSIAANIIIAIIGLFFFILSIFIFFSALYALNYIIIKKQSLKTAIENGLQLFSKNWAISIEAVILIIILSICVSYLSSNILYVYGITSVVLKQTVISPIGHFILQASHWIATIIFVLFIGFITSYQLSLWTLLFERLTKKDYKSVFQSLFKRIKS